MPIFRTGRGVLYFAHVPKCAGTTLETYLTDRFGIGSRSLFDSFYLRPKPTDRWSRSSPQHIDAHSLSLMFGPVFFDRMFAILRHPVLRLRSVYMYQRDVEGFIDPQERFLQWLEALPARRLAD